VADGHIFGGTSSECKKYRPGEKRKFYALKLHLAPLRSDRIEISKDFGTRKLQSLYRLSRAGIVCIIICLATLTEYRLVTDRQTD